MKKPHQIVAALRFVMPLNMETDFAALGKQQAESKRDKQVTICWNPDTRIKPNWEIIAVFAMLELGGFGNI